MKPLNYETRVTLFAHSALDALRTLDKPGLAVCDIVHSAYELPQRIRLMQPHVLVLAEPLPDAETILREVLRLCPARPPRLAALREPGFAVDAVGCDDLTACAPHPCAVLAQPSLARRTACAQALLKELGMTSSLRGYAALAQGAALLSTLPPPLPPLQYALYPLLARQAGVSPGAVERRLRSAIESAWLHGNWAAQNALLGLSVSAERGKPTNSELLFRLAERICELLYPG